MSQIRIEEKNKGGSSIWPWIIGLLILALAVWGIAEAFEESDEVYTEEVFEEDDEVAGVATGIDEDNKYNTYEDEDYMGAVSTYMATTANMEGEMGLDHEFSHRALTELANATVALTESKGLSEEVASKDKVERVKRLADDIMKDPLAGDHADKIKEAALLITEMLEDVDNDAYNGQSAENLSKLREEAQAISPETLTLNQKEDVRSFFRQARMVLERMS